MSYEARRVDELDGNAVWIKRKRVVLDRRAASSKGIGEAGGIGVEEPRSSRGRSKVGDGPIWVEGWKGKEIDATEG